MKKQWIKTSDFNYTFLVDEKEVGKMVIHFNAIADKAICNINGKVFEIQRTGFWKSHLEVTDSAGAIVLKAYPEKWYANTLIVEFENKKFKLLVRNNPLAEFAITENDNDIFVYGLAAQNGDLRIKIKSSDKADFIFDFLLWYLFAPIATENMGDNYSFLLLIS